MRLPIKEVHKPNEQFPFKNYAALQLESFVLYRDNRFTKEMINNRHDMKMTKYNNARYNDQININYSVIDQLNSYLEAMGMERI